MLAYFQIHNFESKSSEKMPIFGKQFIKNRFFLDIICASFFKKLGKDVKIRIKICDIRLEDSFN
jgi:hypothetical protein